MWTDPGAGAITISEWIDRWQAMQDVGPSTEANRKYQIRRFILPYWDKRKLNSLTGEDITVWERHSGRSMAAFTGSLRRTTRTGARTWNRSSRSTSRPSSLTCGPPKRAHGGSLPAPQSTAEVAGTRSSAPTAATTDAATSRGASSGRRATVGTRQRRARKAG
jgi:hypothetical protein